MQQVGRPLPSSFRAGDGVERRDVPRLGADLHADQVHGATRGAVLVRVAAGPQLRQCSARVRALRYLELEEMDVVR